MLRIFIGNANRFVVIECTLEWRKLGPEIESESINYLLMAIL